MLDGLFMSPIDQVSSVFVLSNEPSNARQWRMRAEEMRTLSDGLQDATCRDMALRIARDYDRLAGDEEERDARKFS